MEQYISKSALVAEIERRGNICKKVVWDLRTEENKDYYQGKAEAYKETLDLLNTLEVKEVEEPVNEELEDAARKWLNPKLDKSYANYGETKMMELTHFDGYDMLDAIEFGAEWQKKKDLKEED